MVMNEVTWDSVYGEPLRHRLHELLEMRDQRYTADQVGDRPELLRGVEVLVTGWGAPALTAELLAGASDLRFVVYGAGAISGVMTQAAWDRGIRVTSGYEANAQPVAEFTVAAVVLALKHTWAFAHRVRDRRGDVAKHELIPPGNFETTVGLVSLGAIGRLVARRLQGDDHRVIVADPTITDGDAAEFGCRRVGLEELFATSMAVSLHTPWLPETEGMINEPLLRSMPKGATLINTSRGAVVDEPALCRVAADRPDLQFLLDVTHPEPPARDSPLYDLPNVVLTPHVAGSMGHECRRIGQQVVHDLECYLQGQPLRHEISRELAYRTSHRPKR